MISACKAKHILAVALVASACKTTAMAALVAITPAAGLQCDVSDINNSGVTVGNCSTGNAAIPNQPWVAPTPGTAVILPRLAPSQPCSVGVISNAGWIAGECGSPTGAQYGVTWDANDLGSGILRFNPRPGLIGLFPDVSTRIAAMNQRGDVLGSSIDRSGDSTVVLWAAGTESPLDVSSARDNCSGVDISTPVGSGRPAAAINCPNSIGTQTGKIAQHNGLLYVATQLPTPAGALTCVVTGINNLLRVVGGCQYSTAPFLRAAFWASPNAAPTSVPSLTTSSVSIATSLNNSGQVVVTYEDVNGNISSAFWDTTAGTVTAIAAFTSGVGSSGVALADNGTVLVIGANSQTDTESATWTAATGLQSFGFYNSGKNTSIGAISQDGSKIAGSAEDSTQTNIAVRVQ
ncbi:hypothetical protein J1G35_20520 [Pseudomonas sp. SH10-3B]|uniref:hypothetical protein n=1 Tax=Pseudomonas sp. SH10-3B TaxID=2816049 RepID=UPI001CA6CC2E|nr:hypothetical protein [Pseudomonas sp. SH10-3B]MBY8948248.1 hypothetical protein [Pseudomonas sp. SH10-3B]